uniref:Eukaryotic translation elongation factor 1 beta 2 n=1 Tax=Podarcis muralis TaxID=64176 RepID=A0A670INF5_PODMU
PLQFQPIHKNPGFHTQTQHAFARLDSISDSTYESTEVARSGSPGQTDRRRAGASPSSPPSFSIASRKFWTPQEVLQRYVPSQADIAVFEAVGAPPPPELFHALRWYNHIKSFDKQKASLPGVKKALGKYGPSDVEDSTGTGGDSKDDDDIDLFGSDEEEESEEAKRLREERLAQYESKKSKKPALVAKSSLLLDVKPWDDETDMGKLEECVRSIQADGLVWGSSKLVPVGYGIKKLQIQCVVEDDKVGTDMLEERITAFEDYVQSMDVAAFNKI